jgi:hypothetical protein
MPSIKPNRDRDIRGDITEKPRTYKPYISASRRATISLKRYLKGYSRNIPRDTIKPAFAILSKLSICT